MGKRGRKPGIPHSEQLFRAEIARKLSAAIGNERGAMTIAAKKLDISKQALSLYLAEKATPGSEILRRICLQWNVAFDVEGAVTDSSSFRSPRPTVPPPEQMSLPDALSYMDNQQLSVKVLKKGPKSIDLQVSIDFQRVS